MAQIKKESCKKKKNGDVAPTRGSHTQAFVMQWWKGFTDPKAVAPAGRRLTLPLR